MSAEPAIDRQPLTSLGPLLTAASEAGAEIHRIPDATSRDELFDRLYRSWGFPGYFGRNFDALFDALSDPQLRPTTRQTVIVGPMTQLRAASPRDYELLMSVLTDVEAASPKDAPFHVIELFDPG